MGFGFVMTVDNEYGELIEKYIKATEERRHDDAHKIFLQIKELDKNK